MYILRPIKLDDLDAFEDLANQSSGGIINLPKNRVELDKIIHASLRAFETEINKPYLERYTFVLVNHTTGELGGTCAIVSRMGVTEPNCYFRIETIANEHEPKQLQILTTVNYPIGPSEICALYIKPEFRKEGLGKLLSLSRFFFIAEQRNRFEDLVVAEMRGYIKENSLTPFWEHICRNFYDISYDKICELELKSRSFIPAILPKWPLYVALLPDEAKSCLGKTHDHTVPALKMLNQEGFTFTQEIDPFDGGPKISCKTEDIKTVKENIKARVEALDDTLQSNHNYIVSNTQLDFRSCYSSIKIVSEDTVIIPTTTAQALNVNVGDTIRYLNIKPLS